MERAVCVEFTCTKFKMVVKVVTLNLTTKQNLPLQQTTFGGFHTSEVIRKDINTKTAYNPNFTICKFSYKLCYATFHKSDVGITRYEPKYC